MESNSFIFRLNDSLADSLIVMNQTFLENVASHEYHVAQTDAKSLLEKAGFAQQYEVSLPTSMSAKMMELQKESPPVDNECDMFDIAPNPSDGNMTVKYELPESPL